MTEITRLTSNDLFSHIIVHCFDKQTFTCRFNIFFIRIGPGIDTLSKKVTHYENIPIQIYLKFYYQKK